MSGYGDKEYWDNRYNKSDEKYDWEPMLAEMGIPFEGGKAQEEKGKMKVLVVGCGNSQLSQHLWEDGFKDIISMDYSTTVVDKMKGQYKNSHPKLVFEQGDVTNLEKYDDCTFDLILDKGTLDSILCGSDSIKNARKMLGSITRVMKKTAFYFVVTYGQPSSRLNYLEHERYEWSVDHKSVGGTRHMYSMCKPPKKSAD